MALDLSTITNVVNVVTDVLDKAKDAAPGLLDAAKKLAAGADDLVKEAMANVTALASRFSTMTPEQTDAALNDAQKRLDDALKSVQAAPTPTPAQE